MPADLHRDEVVPVVPASPEARIDLFRKRRFIAVFVALALFLIGLGLIRLGAGEVQILAFILLLGGGISAAALAIWISLDYPPDF